MELIIAQQLLSLAITFWTTKQEQAGKTKEEIKAMLADEYEKALANKPSLLKDVPE